MSTLRAIVVALIALSLAALPVASAQARGLPPDDSQISVHADCCPDGQPCAMQAMANHAKSDHAKGSCADHCGGNCLCLGLTAVLSASTDTLSVPMPLVKSARAAESANSPAYIPPSPPPRV